MKFGKLQDISSVDFQLPPNTAETSKVLAKLPPTPSPTLYVGCTGWGMKEWVGTIYPKGSKPADFLRQYTQQFNTIELNTTHYRIPTLETIAKWKKAAKEDFHFCPKIPQSISHSRDLGLSEGRIVTFCEVIQGLTENLGCCFMQLAPYFGVDRLPILEIEVRHESWFSTEATLAKLATSLEQHKKAFVITDVAGRRDVLHQRLTNEIAVIRFVGNDLHPSDYSRIDDWVLRLKEWFEQGLQLTFLPMNQIILKHQI